MTERIGEYTLKFKSRPGIIASAAIVGSKEGDGPLGGCFDEVIADGTLGKETWEQAESALQQRAVIKAIEKSGMTAADIDLLMAGDLLSQCSGSAFCTPTSPISGSTARARPWRCRWLWRR